MKVRGFAPVMLALVLEAQQPAPRFDVVSIRPVPPNTQVMRDVNFTPVKPGGQFIDSSTPVLFMISFAYDVKNPSTQLSGLPEWAKTRSYSVSAKPAEGFPALSEAQNREQVRAMLRAMLEDRFHLRLHQETRTEPVFQLEVGKGGIKFQEVEAPVPPELPVPVGAAMSDGGGRMIAKKSTMESLAGVLTMFLKRPVVDRTGLKGYYDFDIKWAPADDPEGRTPSFGFGADGSGLLVSTLQDRLGLRLTKTTGPVNYWVVDHVEPPTEN